MFSDGLFFFFYLGCCLTCGTTVSVLKYFFFPFSTGLLGVLDFSKKYIITLIYLLYLFFSVSMTAWLLHSYLLWKPLPKKNAKGAVFECTCPLCACICQKFMSTSLKIGFRRPRNISGLGHVMLRVTCLITFCILIIPKKLINI